MIIFSSICYNASCTILNSLKAISVIIRYRKCFYSTKIEEWGKKGLFKLTKNLMESNSKLNLQQFTSLVLLADEFSNYFMRKTTIIRNKIISDTPNTHCNISSDVDIMLNGNML